MTMRNELSLPPDGGDPLSFQERLYALLSRRAGLYCGCGSSSLPAAAAQALLEGIYFTLGVRPEDGAAALGPLLHADLEEAFQRGLTAIERKIARAKRLCETVQAGLPPIENRSLTDTLNSISRCWPRYDYRCFPQEIPCDIDYQLCLPVPDALLGVDYLIEYLKRLSWENDLLGRFDRRRLIGVLDAYCPDYRGLLINLAEPAAVNALGLVLAGGDPLALTVSDGQRRRIARSLAPLPGPLRVRALEHAAETLCAALGIPRPRARAYWHGLAAGLAPRLGPALERGDLSAIFLSIPVL